VFVSNDHTHTTEPFKQGICKLAWKHHQQIQQLCLQINGYWHTNSAKLWACLAKISTQV